MNQFALSLLTLCLFFAFSAQASEPLVCSELLTRSLTPAFQSRANFKYLESIDQTQALRLDSLTELRPLLKRLRTLDLQKGLTKTQVRRLARELYGITRDQKPGDDRAWFSRFWLGRGPRNSREYLQAQVEIELLTQDLQAALRSQSLLREGGVREGLRTFRSDHENALETANASLWAAFTISSMGFPLFLPDYRFTRAEGIPKELLDKVKLEGFDAAYPELASYFGRSPGFDFNWKVWRRNIHRAVGTYLLVSSLTFLPMTKQILELQFSSDVKAQERQEQTFNPNRVREEQFESWKEAFREFNGRDPDPVAHPEDKAEWDRVWNGLQSTPDDSLKAKFPKAVRSYP